MKNQYTMVGKRLQNARKHRGLSQQALSEIIDCSPQYLSYIETGQKSMSLDTFIMLINALNISADEALRDYLSSTVRVTNHVFTSMLEDCSVFETRVLEDVLRATKKAMREHSRYGSARRE